MRRRGDSVAGEHDCGGQGTAGQGATAAARGPVDTDQLLGAATRALGFFELVMANSPDLVIGLDALARPFYLSPSLTKVFGFAVDEWLGRPLFEQVHPDDLELAQREFAAVLAGETRGGIELRAAHADGRWVCVECTGQPVYEGDVVTGAVVNVRDVTERKRAAERLEHVERAFVRRLEYDATHDALTGLPQRKLALDHLAIALQHPVNTTAVLFVDLDHFKRVNDTLGHGAGDRLLERFAERVTGALRTGDVAGRLGGDEFVIVCREVRDASEALAVARRLMALAAEPFMIEGLDVVVGASIGIALADASPERAAQARDVAATMLRQADTAAYRAKERGRNRCELFDSELHAVVANRLRTETALRHGIGRGELTLHYQPIVRTDDGRVCAFEALVRWNRPDFGLVEPDSFLAIAEDSGLIVPLGLEVFRLGCAQAAQWQAQLRAAAPTVCINLSMLQLVQPDFLVSITDALDDTGVDPSGICLEITESSLMQDPVATIALLERLRGLGLALAIDDFGTGYSSLSHLRQLPVDVLKIDRSFVLEIGADHEGATIVASIVALAHALGMSIVAEGVETVEHVASLHNLGCDRLQGFYFSAALPPAQATDVAERGRLFGPRAA